MRRTWELPNFMLNRPRGPEDYDPPETQQKRRTGADGSSKCGSADLTDSPGAIPCNPPYASSPLLSA
jgi:hypothetical protein